MRSAAIAQQQKELLFTNISNIVDTMGCCIKGRPEWGAFIKMEAARAVLLDSKDFFKTTFTQSNVKNMRAAANKVNFSDKYLEHFSLLHLQHDENLGFCLRYAYAYNIIAPKLKEFLPAGFPFAPT